MPLLSQGVMSALRKLKQDDYTDTAVRLIYTEGTGPQGWAKATYPEGATFAARFVLRSSSVQPSGDVLPGTNVEQSDADLFFDAEVELDPDDRVTITKLYGDRVTALTYDIVAGPVLDSLGKSAGLKLVKE